MKTWMVDKDSMKLHCQTKKNCTWTLPDNGGHCRPRIQTRKNTLERFWNTKLRLVSWSISDTLLPAKVFEIFCHTCIEITKLISHNFVWTRISKVSMSEKYRSKKGILAKCSYATNGIKKSEEESIMIFIDAKRPISSTCRIMTQTRNRHISCTGEWTTSMDGPCDKDCMWMVSDEEKTSLCLMKNSYKTMIKKVTKDISLDCTKKLHKLYSNVLVLSKRMKIDKCEKVVCNLYN